MAGKTRRKKRAPKDFKPLWPVEEMNNYDFETFKVFYCERCRRKKDHTVYVGHTFSEGSRMMQCRACATKTLGV